MAKPAPNPDLLVDRRLGRRVVWMVSFMLLGFSGLGCRLYYLQVKSSEKFRQAAEMERLRKIDLPASRGALYDRHHQVLAMDQTVFSVVADKNHMRDQNLILRLLGAEKGLRPAQVAALYTANQMQLAAKSRILTLLAPALQLAEVELRDLLENSRKVEVVLAKDLDESKATVLRELIQREQIPGIYVRQSVKREYPSGAHAGPVIGFVNAEGNGMGVEYSQKAILNGRDGVRWVERDPRGQESPARNRGTVAPQHGRSLRLTLDLVLQQIVEEELARDGDEAGEIYVPKLKARKVEVILMEPGTAAVLAMASVPTFNIETKEGSLVNTTISEAFEPGSTFKIIAAAGALDAGEIGANTWINCNWGEYPLTKDFKILDEHRMEGGTILDVLGQSSNVGSFKLVEKLGRERFFGYIRNFGFGAPTGIELAGETSGKFKEPHPRDIVTLSRQAFGYGLSTSPLQIIAAYNAILNDGVYQRPRLVEAILSDDNQVVEVKGPEAVRRVCSKAAARIVREGLHKVVLDGTCKKVKGFQGYSWAGKTGTAQKWVPEKKAFSEDHLICSFCGYLPADKPELLAIVVVDDAQGVNNGFGSTIAAPLFRRIALRAMEYMKVPPDQASLAEDTHQSARGSVTPTARPASTGHSVPTRGEPTRR